MCERTDSNCRRALTQAGKQTGISSNSTERTRIKSSMSLPLSDQNSESRAGSQHAGAGMSDTISSGTHRLGSQKNKDRYALMSIQKNSKVLLVFR